MIQYFCVPKAAAGIHIWAMTAKKKIAFWFKGNSKFIYFFETEIFWRKIRDCENRLHPDN